MSTRVLRRAVLAVVVLTGCGGGGDPVDPAPTTRTVTVARSGTGTGSISSSPSGISCGSTCTATLGNTAPITLTAAASAGSQFVDWSGACAGTTATCAIPAGSSSVSATARFDLILYALTVSLAGNGTGTVASAPAGVTCGVDCSESYAAGTAVTLTATPAAASSFTGWTGGGCSGTGPCTVTMNAAATVTATFTLVTNTLTVSRAGTGTGTVTSAPTGITCGADCTEAYNSGTVVTLTAAAGASSTFTGWSGGSCTGTGTCVVTMNAANTVTATFNLSSFALSLTRTGTGSGTVTSSPAGINCGGDCTEDYTFGTLVTLTAAADATSIFGGWSGGSCTGTGTCDVTVNAATSVTALFNPIVPRWPDSFTRFCSDGAVSVTCPGGLAGQDGSYTINAPTYVVLGGRTQDAITGLIWERSPTVTNISHAAALTYCDNLVLDGFSDWRLPSYLDLISIADFGRVGPAFPTAAFPGIPSNSNYWTSTDRAGNTAQAISMNTNYPTTTFTTKTETDGRLVRCVRGTSLSGSLQNVAGDINDARTQLSWQSTTAPTTLNFQDALTYCESLTLNGSSDWRLPNGKELMSIVDPSLTGPAMSILFATRPSTVFWSSSVVPNFPARSYAINFAFGISSGIDTPMTELRDVRCVR